MNASPNIKIFLIGNKTDLEESRQVDKERAQKCKEDYDLDYFVETSAKTGMNVQEIFVRAARSLYKDYIEYKKEKKRNEENNVNKLNQNEYNDAKKKVCY